MEQVFNIIIISIISYFALYIVIWMHEVGHAFFYWMYGYKKKFLQVTVKPFLFFSTPAPVDMEKIKSITPLQELVISYAGIVVNIVSGSIMGLLIKVSDVSNVYLCLFLYQFITLHLAEAISYLVLGNIYLVSDMKNIAEVNPKLRVPNFIIGLVLLVPYVIVLEQVPNIIFIGVLVFNIFTILCMGIGRYIFTFINSKKKNI